jgi:hypothetical protein
LDENNMSYFDRAKIAMLVVIAKPKNKISNIVFGRMLAIFPSRIKRFR